jgi:hypothetical protein
MSHIIDIASIRRQIEDIKNEIIALEVKKETATNEYEQYIREKKLDILRRKITQRKTI